MPWVRAVLKGQRVFARAKASGELDVQGGKVEIRYKANDGRLYHALARNLSDIEPAVLADETCGAAEAPVKAENGARRTRSSAPTSQGDAVAEVPLNNNGVTRARRPGDIIVYTDGACTGNPGPAGIGVVVLRGRSRIELSEFLGVGTNNIAELTAILRGVEEAGDDRERLVVHTDSQYAIGMLSKGWKAKANVELIEKIRARIRGRGGVSFVYVPGHAGVPLNERCDELARLAIKTRASSKQDLSPASPTDSTDE
jgi:ribonuclease HI